MKVNSWTHWQPLKQVVLGNVFPPEFFEDVKDTKLRDSLQRVVHETKEDLDGIKKTLEDLGVEVILVDDCWTDGLGLNPYKTFGEFLEKSKESKGLLALPKPLMSPRNSHITMGNDLFITQQYNPQMVIDGKHPLDMFDVDLTLVKDTWKNIDSKLGPFRPNEQELKNELWTEQEYFDMNMKHDPVNFRNFVYETWNFDAPFITRIGDTILVDEGQSNYRKGIADWYNNIRPDNKFKFKLIDIGGHNDGSMCLPKPGLVIAAPWMEKGFFENTLPGWDQLIIEHPNNFEQQYPKEYEEFKKNKKADMNWYVDNEKNNKPFTDFVDTYLKDWVGFMEESIFEVNMLSINENTILSINYQKEVHDKLKSVGIEPIYTRFRHRHFWDSGLHCLTLDTYREGGCETYL
tara:strand:+ start:551 stop:1762 length:1212 start_codon:yes stop_codon:yes gene_type:complete